MRGHHALRAEVTGAAQAVSLACTALAAAGSDTQTCSARLTARPHAPVVCAALHAREHESCAHTASLSKACLVNTPAKAMRQERMRRHSAAGEPAPGWRGDDFQREGHLDGAAARHLLPPLRRRLDGEGHLPCCDALHMQQQHALPVDTRMTDLPPSRHMTLQCLACRYKAVQ